MRGFSTFPAVSGQRIYSFPEESGIVGMVRTARYIGLIVLAYGLAYWMDYEGTFIHRADFDKAVVAYAKNPTPQNQAALDREQQISHEIRMHDSAVAAAIEVGLVCGFWAFLTIYYKRKRRSLGSQAPL